MMDEKQQQFITLIARQVIAVLEERGLVAGGRTSLTPSTASSTTTAPVRPPLGTCTGDYSKFPELRGRLTTASTTPSPATPAESEPAPPTTSAPIAPLSGIITATQLQEALAATTDGVVVLAHGARLTPLANDLVRKDPQLVRRATAGGPATPTGAAATLPWIWWIDGQCPAVSQLIAQRGARLHRSAAGSHSTNLAQVARELSSALRAHSVAGGVLFVPSAARTMCYVNRCSAIRAVVGTCGEAVEQGIRELGANVLVIEYPHVGPRAMQEMVDRMLQQSPSVPSAVERDLADLHRCG